MFERLCTQFYMWNKKNIKNVNKIFINEIVSKLNEKIDNWDFQIFKELILKFDEKKLSCGCLWFNIIVFVLELLKKLPNEKISLFFDEPDNFLHPKWIDKYIKLVLNENKNIDFYIASHDYYFLTNIINNSNNKRIPIEIHVFSKQKNDQKEEKFDHKKIDNESLKKIYITADKILYDIFGVVSITFLDYLLAELAEKVCINGEFNKLWSNDDFNICKKHPNIKRIFDGDLECENCIMNDNGRYKHYSIINFVRNYYHHPDSREDLRKDWNNKLKKPLDIENMLKESIENMIELLGENYKKIT